MAGVADGLVIEFFDIAEERIGQRRCAAAGLEGFERRKAVERQTLDLGHRIDLGDLAVADNSGDFEIFIYQAFDGENELVIERRLRVLRQAADADVDLVDECQIWPHHASPGPTPCRGRGRNPG